MFIISNINISSGNDATNIINMIKNKEINFEGQGYKIYMSNGDVYTEDTNYTEPEWYCRFFVLLNLALNSNMNVNKIHQFYSHSLTFT